MIAASRTFWIRAGGTVMDRFMGADTGQVSVTGEFLAVCPGPAPSRRRAIRIGLISEPTVYSLGVILYQILTGAGNFRTKWWGTHETF